MNLLCTFHLVNLKSAKGIIKRNIIRWQLGYREQYSEWAKRNTEEENILTRLRGGPDLNTALNKQASFRIIWTLSNKDISGACNSSLWKKNLLRTLKRELGKLGVEELSLKNGYTITDMCVSSEHITEETLACPGEPLPLFIDANLKPRRP